EPGRNGHPVASQLGPIVVEIDGRMAGMFQFGRSARPACAEALQRIRDVAPVPIALVSSPSQPDVAAFAALLGADVYKGGCAPDDTACFLRICRQRGLRTAFVGHFRRQAPAAAEAHVSIAMVSEADAGTEAGSGSGSDTHAAPDSAAVLLLQPRLDG